MENTILKKVIMSFCLSSVNTVNVPIIISYFTFFKQDRREDGTWEFVSDRDFAHEKSKLKQLASRKTGNDLLSQAVSRQASSALGSLTAVFGMGTGVSSPLLSPDFFF